MRYWLVRVLLNLGVLVGAAAIGVAGMMTTGSPLSFGFSVLIYFFVAWGLANHVTRGRAQVDIVAYLRPLFLTYWLLATLGLLYMFVELAAAAINPQVPDFAAGFSATMSFWPLVQTVVGGLVVSAILMIPPLVAIVDRPPPGQPLDAPDPTDRQITEKPAQPALAAPVAVEQVRQVPPPQTQASLPTDLDREETLEELLGLEPSRHG